MSIITTEIYNIVYSLIWNMIIDYWLNHILVLFSIIPICFKMKQIFLFVLANDLLAFPIPKTD